MWQTLIAVAGTLAGAITTHLLGARATRRAEMRRDQLTAVTTLATALADHRRTMWVHKDSQLSGATPAAVQAAREATHATRAAITAPALAARVILPAAVHATAQTAITATYAMRDAATPDDLTARRQAALTAAEAFTAAASAYLRRHR